MLSDKDFRSTVIDEIDDPVLLNFWLNEFSQYSKGHRTEALAPIQNKLGEFALNPISRSTPNAFGVDSALVTHATIAIL